MNKMTLCVALAAATALASPAHAGSPEGRWQLKLLGTGVLVDGKITKVDKDAVGLPAGSQADINDNAVPTVAVEWYATRNVSIETICCLTQHHASGAGALAGAGLVDHVMILPATVTVKYHLDAGPVNPYVGVGPRVFFFIDERPGATPAPFANRVRLDNRAGVALQAGLDIPVNSSGMGVSLDAKKYFIGTTAHFINAAGAEVLTTEHKLDPWVVSGGVYLRF